MLSAWVVLQQRSQVGLCILVSLLSFVPLFSLHHPFKVELLLCVAERFLLRVHRRVLNRRQREVPIRFTVDQLYLSRVDIALLALRLLQDCGVYLKPFLLAVLLVKLLKVGVVLAFGLRLLRVVAINEDFSPKWVLHQVRLLLWLE